MFVAEVVCGVDFQNDFFYVYTQLCRHPKYDTHCSHASCLGWIIYWCKFEKENGRNVSFSSFFSLVAG